MGAQETPKMSEILNNENAQSIQEVHNINEDAQARLDVQHISDAPDSERTAPRQKFRFPRITDRVWRSALVVLATAIIYEYLF